LMPLLLTSPALPPVSDIADQYTRDRADQR
jgi:hypothetical protein